MYILGLKANNYCLYECFKENIPCLISKFLKSVCKLHVRHDILCRIVQREELTVFWSWSWGKINYIVWLEDRLMTKQFVYCHCFGKLQKEKLGTTVFGFYKNVMYVYLVIGSRYGIICTTSVTDPVGRSPVLAAKLPACSSCILLVCLILSCMYMSYLYVWAKFLFVQ